MSTATTPLQGDALYAALETPSPFTIWRLGGAGLLTPLHWDLWTKNGVPADVWENIIVETSTPEILLLPPDGYWRVDAGT